MNTINPIQTTQSIQPLQSNQSNQSNPINPINPIQPSRPIQSIQANRSHLTLSARPTNPTNPNQSSQPNQPNLLTQDVQHVLWGTTNMCKMPWGTTTCAKCFGERQHVQSGCLFRRRQMCLRCHRPRYTTALSRPPCDCGARLSPGKSTRST